MNENLAHDFDKVNESGRMESDQRVLLRVVINKSSHWSKIALFTFCLGQLVKEVPDHGDRGSRDEQRQMRKKLLLVLERYTMYKIVRKM